MIMVMIGAAAHPDKHMEFAQTVLSLLAQIRESQGCLSCHLYYKSEDENAFCLIEKWSSQKDFKNHTRTNTFAILRGAMQILLREPPRIKVYEIVARILEDLPSRAN